MVLSFLSVRSVAWADPGSDINPPIPAEDLSLAPPGANDWNCRPSDAHPRPVILVHGTAADMATTWRVLSPELKAEGYCVFSLNYGGAKMVIPPFKTVYGVTDIRLSARQLAQFVDTVLSRTGSSQVDIVGHSQGGTLARQYLKFEGGANSADPASNKVRTLVTLGATNHGTTWAGDILQRLYELAASLGFGSEAAYQFLFGMAMSQQTVGSPLLQDLNADGDTEAGVMYTVIASRADNMVTPPERTFLSTNGRAADVNNIWVQDGCPSDQTAHTSLTFDARSLHLVKVGLDPSYADRHPAPCGS
ncbi:MULTISPECIES: esterase/lipase family protein [Rhodococcus]|nr:MULTISPECIES: alpha/beta fold hydrolase [Rhodococcus]